MGSLRMTFIPGTTLLAYPDKQNSLVLYDVASKEARFRCESPAGSKVRIWDINATPDGKTLVAGYEDGIVKVFDLKKLP